MSDDRNPQDRYAEFTEPVQQSVRAQSSGCLSAFAMLWGIACMLVGLLILAVTGYCSFSFLLVEHGDQLLQGFGGIIFLIFIAGLALCMLGYWLLRHFGRNL